MRHSRKRFSVIGAVAGLLLASSTAPIEAMNGPRFSLAPQAGLYDVSALGPSDVWGVGSYWDGHAYRTLAEHWNGTKWSKIPTVDPDADGNFFHAVTAVSDDDVWAVGDTYSGGLVEHWNGAKWRVVDSPGSYLTDVDAFSATDIWAVGGIGATFIMHWDGTSWTVVPGPAGYVSLGSVSVRAPSDVWAAGLLRKAHVTYNFIMHWDGSSWTRTPAGSRCNAHACSMHSVVALGPANALAVGYFDSGPQKTYSLVWRGDGWVRVPCPTPPLGSRPQLLDVDGVSQTDAWAVGQRFNAGTVLIKHWNGERWRVINESGSGLDTPILDGVSADSATDAWAVGSTRVGATSIVMHWDGRSWTMMRAN